MAAHRKLPDWRIMWKKKLFIPIQNDDVQRGQTRIYVKKKEKHKGKYFYFKQNLNDLTVTHKWRWPHIELFAL